ncbi:MAG: O-methyltransferase [Ferruginibacter sp.]|nr:O-methyltransferase [Cytophagales bacterium]
MNFLPENISAYAEAHTAPETPLLARINRDTHAHVMYPRMLSGHLQGRVLAMFSRMIQPTNILEIGTYTGYSAICLAEGLREDGTLYTLDVNEELEARTRGYFAEAGLTHRIDYRIGPALDLIPQLNAVFDLVFIDADKSNNARYYDLVFEKVRSGGFILVDNVLWSGKATVSYGEADKDTRLILDFNRKLHQDARVENVLLPIRDGLMVARKKG